MIFKFLSSNTSSHILLAGQTTRQIANDTFIRISAHEYWVYNNLMCNNEQLVFFFLDKIIIFLQFLKKHHHRTQFYFLIISKIMLTEAGEVFE